MRKTSTPGGRIIGGLVAIVVALIAMCSVIGVTVAPAQAATVPKYDIVTHPVPSDYQQFVLDTTRIQETQVSFNEHWYQTTTWIGKTVFFPLSKDAAVTVHNVGTWTDTSGTHAIDMTVSVQDWQGGLVLFKDGGLWFRTSGHPQSPPEPVLQSWHTTFTPVDGRDGDTWRVDFTYADTHQPVPDTFKGVTGFNDLDGGDNLSEGVELVSGFTGAYLLPHAELQAFGNNGWYGIIRDSEETDLNHGVQTLHRLAATFSGSSFVFRYSVNHTSLLDPWSTFGVPLDPAQLRVMVTTVFVDDAGKTLRPADTQTLGVGDSWHVVPPNIAGYQFTGLGKSSDALDGTVTSDNIADRTVILTYARKTAILHYNLNGGDGDVSDTKGYVNETVHITDKTPTREGYSFTGWNTKADGSGTAYVSGASVVLPAGGATLYAQWKANPAKLLLDPNGAGGETTTLNGVTGGQVSTTGHLPTREGYTLTGWNTSKDGTGVGYAPETEYTLPAGTTTWFAQWTANKAIVSYNANGGKGSMSDVETTTGATVTVAKNGFTRKGYSFTGWALTPQGTVVYQPQDALKVSRQPLVLYAVWEANPSRITYNLKGGDGVIPNTVGKVDETVHVTDKNPTRKGYTFNGWKDCKADTSYQPNSEITLPDGGIALCAQWSANPSQVTYNLNGGDGSIDPTVGRVDETVRVTDKTPTRKGYTFVGWNTKPDGSGEIVANTLTLPDGGLKLYAQWKVAPAPSPAPKAEELAQTGSSTTIIAVACAVLVVVAGGLLLVRRFLQHR